MLACDQARNGAEIIRLNGRLVCSRVDPLQEAQKWVKKVKKDHPKNTTIIVLGLGCAYHVVELKQTFNTSRIVVIEPAKAVVEWAKKNHSLILTGVDIVQSPSLEELRSHSMIQEVVKKPYSVWRFGPRTHESQKFFGQAEELLLGRNPQGVELLLDARSELKSCFDENGLKQMSQKNCLSLMDLKSQMIQRPPGMTRQQESLILSFQLLRELVV